MTNKNKLFSILSMLACCLSISSCKETNEQASTSTQQEEEFVGLYDNKEIEEVTYKYTKENMMYDFEEEASVHRGLYFNNVCGCSTWNKDPKYVTCGEGSLKVRVDGRAEKGAWSMIYFVFDEKFSDFTKIDSINFDILYESEDNTPKSYSIGGTASRNDRFETENKVWANPGEWYHFVIYPNEILYAASTGLVFEWGVKMKEEYLRTMNNLYLSFKPFAQGDKPVVVYIDNVYVEYKD